ncbi:ABC transporter ATP-binding protein [Flindersiella endophytica]
MSLSKLAAGYHVTHSPGQARATLRRTLRFVAPYKAKLAAYIALLAGSALAGVVPPLMFRRLIDGAIPGGDLAEVNVLMAIAVGAYLLSSVVQLAGGYLGTLIGTGIIRDLRRTLFDHFQRLPVDYFVKHKSGEVQSRLNNDVINAQQMFTGQLFTGSVGSVVSDVLVLGFILGAMFALSWQISLATLVLTPLFLLASGAVARRVHRLVREQMELFGDMNAFTAERFNVAGALLVKLFSRHDHESRLFGHRINALRRNNITVNTLALVVGGAIALAGFTGVAIVYWTGGVLAVSGTVTVGTVVALAAYIQRAYTPLVDLASARMNIQGALVSFERVFEIIDTPFEVDERPDARSGPIDGTIRIDRVGFRYPDSESEALRDVSFSVPAGTMTALVGRSGAGKSTLCLLVRRLYDVTGGSITLDGVDVRDYALDALADQIGVVTQDPHFFHESVRANLRYAKPDATERDLVSACEAAQIHELIVGLPEGYDTVMGERGYRFSGGEKQRLALARILLRDPRIVILDEATAHLDTRTERLVQRALEEVLRGRTSIVIAHRLSTIERADQIVVLGEGRVLGSGTHQALLASNAAYQELARATAST